MGTSSYVLSPRLTHGSTSIFDHWQLSSWHLASGCPLFVGVIFLSFRMVLMGGKLLKATYWQLSSTESSLACRKPHPCSTSPQKCWPTLTLCRAIGKAAPASFWPANFFSGVSHQVCAYPLKLQGTPMVLSEEPLEIPFTNFRMSGRSVPILPWGCGGKQCC